MRDKIATMGTVKLPPGVGVNIFGYFFAESGVGEHSRQLVETVRRAGVPYAAVPYTRTLTRQDHPFVDSQAGEPVFPINIVSVNADELPHFATDVGPEFLSSRYTIGLWAWEIESFPARMARSQRFLDEVWANSTFSAKAIERAVDCPVLAFPLPVSVPDLPPVDRRDLGLDDSFAFLFCFDFDSVFERKNPTAVVRAFRTAFPDRPDVSLTIKTINGAKHAEKQRLLQAAADGEPRIHLVDGYWTAERTRALMRACDAYISLHRAEGFGLTLAETMAYGKPVIATDYSGNLDFMDSSNSYLVPAQRAVITEACGPYPKGAFWSEPDIDEAARLMRRVVEQPAEAQQKGLKGRRDIESRHSPDARSRFVRERIEALAAELPDASTFADLPRLRSSYGSEEAEGEERRQQEGFVGAAEGDEAEAISHYSARLEEGPDLRCETGFGKAGLWLRRLIFRLLRNYHLHQVQLGRAGLLVMRELDRENRETRRRLAALEERIERLEPAGSANPTAGEPRRR